MWMQVQGGSFTKHWYTVSLYTEQLRFTVYIAINGRYEIVISPHEMEPPVYNN